MPRSQQPRPHDPLWRDSSLRIYLRQLRTQQGYSIEQFCWELGYSRGWLNARERGYIAPTLIELMEWAQLLGYRLCVVPEDVSRKSSPARRTAGEAEIAAQMEMFHGKSCDDEQQ